MTFSVVVSVPAAGLLGAATASRSLAVGNAVPALRPGVGAVVSQAWTNRSLRGKLLAALAAGAAPTDALAAELARDRGRERRQVAVVDAMGRTADHTGVECTPWAGSRPVGDRDRPVVGVAVGNLVVDRNTVDAVAQVVAATVPDDPGTLAALLVAALRAGQRAGGDVRGQQSAAVLVGSGAGQDWQPPDLDVDLRVDDHERPLEVLAHLAGQVTARTG